MSDNQPQEAPQKQSRTSRMPAFFGGLVVGVVLTGVAVWQLMPGMMLEVQASPLGFDETVSTLQQAISDQGWQVSTTMDLNKSLAKHGVELEPRVKIIKLCQPQYAKEIMTTDRYVSCLMPCSFAVWEDDEGQTMISRMNTGLMGTLFGGKIAEVMGQKVAHDEERMIAALGVK